MLNRKITLAIVSLLVLGGLFISFQNTQVKETYAVDPMTVTYDGNTTPEPVFEITNMLPGDEIEKEVNVANNLSSGSFNVAMSALPTQETQGFADILEVIVGEVAGPDIYGGTLGYKSLQNLFDDITLNLGAFPATTDKTFRIKVKFPFESGNEYQGAKVIFDLKFETALNIDLPPECSHLAGLIVNVVEGTEASEKLEGTVHGDLILGLGGNDYIKSSSASDCVLGGEGNDKIFEESGNGVILGGPGNDRIESGSGEDIIYGGSGNDNIDSGSGNDVIYGESGEDHLDGGDNDDEIYGGAENDTLRGGSGLDKLFGESGNDNIHGGSGDDVLDGGDDSDNLHGNSGTDVCVSGETTSFCEL